MAFNVSEKDRPEFNKLVRKELYDVLNNVQRRAFETLVEETRDPFIDAFNNIEQPPSEGANNIYDAVFNEVQQAPLVAVDAEKKPSYADSIRRKDIPPGGDPKDFIITDPKEILSTPLYEDKVRLLGLVDEDYKVTDFGAKFSNLMEAGIFDENGVLTPKGRAYSLSDMELRDPANIKEFNILREDEVIRESASAGEIVGGVGNLLKDAALGVVELAPILAQNAYYQFDNRKGFGIPFFRPSNQDNRPQSLKDKTIVAATSTAETWAKNFIELKGLADVGANLSMRAAGQLALDGLDPELDAMTSLDVQLAQQRQWSDREVVKDMEVGEVGETILSIEGAVAEAQEVKKRMGEVEFNKLYGRAGATMQLVSPENFIPVGAAFKFAKGPALASRLDLLAQKTVGDALYLQQTTARASLALAENQNIINRNALVQNRANRIIDQGGPNALRAKEILDSSNKAAREAQELIPALTKTIQDSTRQAANLSSRIPVAVAEATLKVTQAGRNLRAMPAKVIGTTIEGFGNTLTKVDDAVEGFLKERGLDKAYSAAIGAAGVVGLAGSPVIGAVAGGAAILKAGKFISNYGKLFNYVGKEMNKVRGQISFWKRVAAHTTPGTLNAGIAHTFNMLDLGGVTSDVLRRTGRGVAAAYPVDLMFEYLSDGGDMRPQTFLQAGAESLVIGGSFAAAGGAFMGTKQRMRDLSIGDQLNLVQSMTDDRQKALYYTLPSGVRSAVATYGIANPTLNYVFKDSGASNYDPNTNTATINVKSNNPIRPLIAHETLHHTIIKNNMEGGISALFLGDTVNNTVGGLLRSRDGKLDPNFAAFRERYYQRLNLAGMTDAEKNAIYPLEKVAVEYFIEQHSDQYAEMAESGELGAIAASGDTKRKLSGVLDTVLPRIPVLRDLHFKSGGMIDKDGGWVTGNGILDAEGVRTNPIASKMFRDMNRRSSGRSPGRFDPLVSDKQDSGAQITLDPTKPIDAELLHPLVKVDENGVPILENGKPVALDKATLLERALAGLTAREAMTRKKAENYIPEKGEAHIDDFNEYVPGWLSNDVLADMFAKNRFNPEQKRIIREVNRMIRDGSGGRAVMINFPATTRNKSGKVVYKPQAATLRDTVPVAITISKDGNLLFGLMSVTKLQENIQKRSKDRRGKKLYGGNVDLILRDTVAMMQFHKDGVDSIEYFKEKYGAVEADERKKFINTMFGLLNQKEQAVLNPMILEDGVKSKDNVYRTYRADRVSKAVAMNADEYPAMPFSYEAVSAVRMPEQTRQMPEDISPEDLTPIANRVEAKRLFADGKRMFAVNEMDGTATEIISLEMLNSYPPDSIGYMDTDDQSSVRYMPEKVNTIPESDGGSLKPATYETLEKVGYNPAASEKTQITSTASTYEKIVKANAKKGMKVLDFSAGRGAGTASIKQIGKSKGFEVSGYEPYSNPKTRIIAPEYEGIDSLAKIPDNSYDLIINNAVLNVVPEDVGRGIVRDIYSKLAPEGSAFISVMGWNNIKGRLSNPKTKLVGPREVVTQKGTFQKGYTPITLRSLIESELPDAKVVRTGYGEIGFKITKPPIKIIKEGASDVRYMPERKEADNLKLLQTRKTLRNWAEGQESWKDWYSEHQETLDDFFGDYAELFQEILAVTSQASSVKSNVALGLKAFGQLMRNEPFDGYLPAVIGNLNAIKNKTAVGGRKISNYKSANEGDSSKVVVDRHISRMLFGVDTPSAKQYAKAEKVLTQIAKELGWEPSQVQAALWAQSIAMSGKEPVSYGSYLRKLESKQPTKRELINGIKGNEITKRIGEIVGSSYGFDPTSKDRGRYSPSIKDDPEGRGRGVSYMPEPLSPKTYETQKGYDTSQILKSKLDDDGRIILTRPTAPDEALTLIRDRREIKKEIPIGSRDKFSYDELAKVALYENEGQEVSFNFDPDTQVKPVFKDAAVELSDKNVQIAMADRATAALGDLGGMLFPNLKVNQTTFTGADGIKYRPVWANMGWKPVLSMKVKAIQQGSTNLLVYIMGKDAHASNLRTVRTVSNEIANAGLEKRHKDLFITLASYGFMLENNASQAQNIKKHSDRLLELNTQTETIDRAKLKKDKAKLNDLIKKAKGKIVKVPTEFETLSALVRGYRSASTRFENGNGSIKNKNANLEKVEAYLKTTQFKKLSSSYGNRQLIEISNTFKGRKAALNATTGFDLEGFSTNGVIDRLGEFEGATNNQVLGAVELSSNPDLFAIYLGDDIKQIKFMTPAEKEAAKFFKEHPDFVRHEAYSWVMLGPEGGNNFLNSNPKKLIDYFKDFADKYKTATGKYPKTENSKVGAMRDGMSVVLKMPKTKAKTK